MSMTEFPNPPAAAPASGLPSALAAFARDIKLSHSVFAMPWALLATAMAGHGQPSTTMAGKLALIALCMVTARTVAMAANRILDAEIDANLTNICRCGTYERLRRAVHRAADAMKA